MRRDIDGGVDLASTKRHEIIIGFIVGLGRSGSGCGVGMGVQKGSEIVERERSVMTAVEGVGVEVEDGFSGGGGGRRYDGFR